MLESLVTYLADHPTDFRGAPSPGCDATCGSIYFSAYQSFLWNKSLGRLIEAKTRPEQRLAVDFKVATLPIHHDLDPDQAEELGSRTLPLPATRTPLPESGEVRVSLAVLGVVAERGAGVERPAGEAPQGCVLLQR